MTKQTDLRKVPRLQRRQPSPLVNTASLLRITSARETSTIIMQIAQQSEKIPSSRWTSYDGWDYNGMKERLETFMARINKSALVTHAEELTGNNVSISEPFSAGQFWCCFELVDADGTLLIARVRLPRHPDSNDRVDEKSELYAIECEVATMEFLGESIEGVPFPRLHAYEGPSSQRAADVGATYMLIEGFFGNTLQDVQFDICVLPVGVFILFEFLLLTNQITQVNVQDHIIAQWTRIQAELASFTFPTVGSISRFSKEKGATIDRLCVAKAESFDRCGPFTSSVAYFAAVGRARNLQACRENEEDGGEGDVFSRLGPYVFQDIVNKTALFNGPSNYGPFLFNHMDMGTQNILVDDDFNFLAIIDWEFAQSAPWQVNHFPMPFPLTSSDKEIEDILKDPDDIAYPNVSRQHNTRQMYRRAFERAVGTAVENLDCICVGRTRFKNLRNTGKDRCLSWAGGKSYL